VEKRMRGETKNAGEKRMPVKMKRRKGMPKENECIENWAEKRNERGKGRDGDLPCSGLVKISQ
jgi:hypothetical protein